MEIVHQFKKHFKQSESVQLVRAPGRVNVIGEHTDYNDGFVFPAAIDKYVMMAGSLRKDNRVRIYSIDLDEATEFELDSITHDRIHPWANYPAGVIKLVLEKGFHLGGMNLAFSGNIPMGAGLSSSAALEMATAYILKRLQNVDIDPIDTIKLCQRVENEFVGVNCGIMDQFISCLGKKGHALWIDCRSLKFEAVPILTSDVRLVIANTNVKHSLVDSAYNQCRQECEEAVRIFKELTGEDKKALRDVSINEFFQYRDRLPESIRQRAEHVIFENQRVFTGIEVLNNGDLIKFGELMYHSHQSLRDLYKVSCPELDLLVQLAYQVKGVYGSRMTGGGFGGCTVNLVQADHIQEFVSYVGDKYKEEAGIKADFYICEAVDGAEVSNPMDPAPLV